LKRRVTFDPVTVPRRLIDAAVSDGREAWLSSLPAVVTVLRDRWALAVGDPFEPGGHTAWVAPATDTVGRRLVVKVGWRHPEAEHEAEGLQFWNGDGAVRLHAAERFDDTIALLLERCEPGAPLARKPETDQDQTLAGLMLRLWNEPPVDAVFRPLADMCDQWADEFEQRISTARHRPADPGLIRAGIALFRALPATAPRHVLLCADLHAENVLAAQRQPWLVIDPKPYLGDPTYDPLQHLLNCDERLRADPVGLAHRMADLVDVDRERLLLWLFARCIQESLDWPHLAAVAERIAPT
jgi:streptomycin 6-kinase